MWQVRPSSGYSEMRPLIASLLAVVAGVIPQFVTASVAGQIGHTFTFSHEMLGVSIALFNLVGVVLSPLMGRVLPRLGVTTALRVSAGIAATTSLAIALLASSAWALVALLSVAGISNGAAGPTASALVRSTVAERRHGLAFGTQQAGAPSALLLAGVGVPFIAVPFGWRWSFVGIAVVAFAAWLAVPASAPVPAATPRTTSRPARPGGHAVVWLLVIVSAGASVVAVGVVSFLLIYATESGMSPSAAGGLLGAVSLAAMIGRIGFGLRADRGRDQPLSMALPLLLACSIGVTVLTIPSPIAIVAAALLMGGLGWAWNGVLTLAVVRETPDSPVWAVGMLMSGVFVGSVVGPLLVGFLSSQLSFRWAWTICALLSLIPLVALVLARRRVAATAKAGRRRLAFAAAPITGANELPLKSAAPARTVTVVGRSAMTPGKKFMVPAAIVTGNSSEPQLRWDVSRRATVRKGVGRSGGDIMRVQVGIVGAGPAGLVLSHLLHQRGITSIVLEKRSREHVEQRVRAGVLEQGTVDLIASLGIDDGLRRHGLRHEGVEWRVGGHAYRIPVSELTGGRAVTVYGQRELVTDLIRTRLDTGEPLVFEADDVGLHDLDGDRARLTYRSGSVEHEVECDFVAGCDGFHGVSRDAIPASEISVRSYVFPFSWLGILATVAPSTNEVIYAHHPRGFALHSMRSPSVSRLYLQCDPDDDIAGWPDERIWDELQTRLAISRDWALGRGPIVDKAITPIRSSVAEPMQYGRLFLAGDAAHIVPPTGAKGLNLAVADAAVLASGVASWYRSRSRSALDAYSSICLDRVWRVQHFASWMTSMFHTSRATGEYGYRLQALQLENVCTSREAARGMAENYVGLPIQAGALTPGGDAPSRTRRRASVAGRAGPPPSLALVGGLMEQRTDDQGQRVAAARAKHPPVGS